MANTDTRTYLTTKLNLRVREGTDQYTAKCPFHDDRNKSFSVNIAKGLWKCHAGCGQGGLAAFRKRLNGAETEPAPAAPSEQEQPKKTSVLGKVVARYQYTDEAGRLVFTKLRYSPKSFKIEGPKGERDLSGITARPLYNLPRVLKAEQILFCEGEKDADNAQAVLDKLKLTPNWAATSGFSGTDTPWLSEYSEALHGKCVTVAPDNDEPGRKYADTIIKKLLDDDSITVKQLDMPGLPEKADVTDYIEELKPGLFGVRLQGARLLDRPLDKAFVRASEWGLKTPEKVPWAVEDFLAFGSISGLIGKNKMGKSTFTHSMLRSIRAMQPFLTKATVPTPVVYLSEMPETDLRFQLKEAGLLEWKDLHILFWFAAMDFSWDEIVRAAIRHAKRVGAKLLVVDTFSNWSGVKDENNNAEVIQLVRPLERAAAAGIAVWVESHARKAGGDIRDAGRGASSLGGKLSIMVHLNRPDGNHPDGYRMIETVGRYRSLKAVVELKGADYVYVGSRAAVADDVARGRLITVAAREEKAAITLKQWIAKTAVNGSRAVSRTTAQRAIDKMVEHGAVVRLPAPKRAGGDRFFFKAGREKF